LGERPVAGRGAGRTARRWNCPHLTEHCRNVCVIQGAEQLIIRDSLPRNPSGSNSRRVLRAELEASA